MFVEVGEGEDLRSGEQAGHLNGLMSCEVVMAL